jgi:hypothetical protein
VVVNGRKRQKAKPEAAALFDSIFGEKLSKFVAPK